MADVRVIKNTYTVDRLFQWDRGQELVIYGLSLPIAPEIHFAHGSQEYATVCQSSMDAAGVIRVGIPDEFLQKAQPLKAYVCTDTAEAFRSLHCITIPVLGRSKPGDYEEDDANA